MATAATYWLNLPASMRSEFISARRLQVRFTARFIAPCGRFKVRDESSGAVNINAAPLAGRNSVVRRKKAVVDDRQAKAKSSEERGGNRIHIERV
jgi:hypothetical protein